LEKSQEKAAKKPKTGKLQQTRRETSQKSAQARSSQKREGS